MDWDLEHFEQSISFRAKCSRIEWSICYLKKNVWHIEQNGANVHDIGQVDRDFEQNIGDFKQPKY